MYQNIYIVDISRQEYTLLKLILKYIYPMYIVYYLTLLEYNTYFSNK